MKLIFLILLTLTSACNSQQSKVNTEEVEHSLAQDTASQIAQYVVDTFQDSKGNLWFGTLEKGVAKYDGKQLIYLTVDDGLPSNRVVNVIEDDSGNLWFATGAGLSKYNGKTFTNFSEADGLCSPMISNLLIDSKGTLWIGTWGGVCKFDGTQFENFKLPYPKIKTKINPDTKDWITTIAEDSQGNIWIGRDGYGLSKYDGKTIVNMTTQDGLNSNNVQSIAFDKEGNMWIGTRVSEKDNPDPDKRFGKAGLNKYDGDKFIHFPEIKGLSGNDVYGIYTDNKNDLWFSTINQGVYKYTNNAFVNYEVPHPTVTFLEDEKGIVWLGCAGGLFKIDADGEVINVKTNGPWD